MKAHTLLILSCLTGTGLLPVEAQKKSDQVAWWRLSWDRALEEAELRNVPIVIAVIQDGEEANERLIDSVLKTSDFCKAVGESVAIFTSLKDHGLRRVKSPEGGSQQVCRRLGGTTCDAHRLLELRVRENLFSGNIKTPQVLVCKPDLTIVSQIIDVNSVQTYANAVRKAQTLLGPGISKAALAQARKGIAAGKNLLKRKRYREAWDAVAPFSAGKTPFARRAKLVQDEVGNHYNNRIEEAGRALEKRDFWTGLVALDRIQSEMKGTPIESRVRDLIKSVSKDKAAKKVVSLLKKQKRYRPQLAKARDYVSKRRYKDAVKQYQSVIKKAKGLPIAKEAEEALAALEEDPAVRAVIRATRRAAEAKAQLKEARKLSRSGQAAEAEKILRRIVAEYPGTSAARSAKKMIR